MTLGDLDEVKKSFITTLRSMLHKRVAYTKAETEVETRSGRSRPRR